MSMDAVRLAERLRAHAWLDAARCGHAGHVPGLVLVLNASGIDALHRLGRSKLLRQLCTEAGHDGTPAQWRLLDRLPAGAGQAFIDACLREPLPREPDVLHETCHHDACTLRLRVPLDLAHFAGHFPAAPLVPGVVQVGWALALAAPRLGTPMQCRQLHALKFQQLLRPGDRLELALHYDAGRDMLQFAYRDGTRRFSSGRLAWSSAA